MDTRQLAAFCAVVERRSFSQAADRLGVTQPAVSLQVRALEKRLGTQLLDRSGRRVEPTEAGWRLYRGVQAMPALEDQLLAEVAASSEGELSGDLVLGASTGPAAVVVPVVLGEFQRQNPGVRVFLTVSDTHSVVERVAARELELGIVGASRRHRGVRFEPFFSDEVILVCPLGSDRLARRAARGAADPHAGGGGRATDRRRTRSGVRASGCAISTFGSSSAFRSPCAAPSRRVRRDVHLARRSGRSSPPAVSSRLASEGLEATREISLRRRPGRARTQVAEAFVEFARERLHGLG